MHYRWLLSTSYLIKMQYVFQIEKQTRLVIFKKLETRYVHATIYSRLQKIGNVNNLFSFSEELIKPNHLLVRT